MSRMRIIAKVRTNPDFKAIARFLDEHGLSFVACPPLGKGHPYLLIAMPDGREVAHTITCTPCGRANATARVATLRRVLIAAGWSADAK